MSTFTGQQDKANLYAGVSIDTGGSLYGTAAAVSYPDFRIHTLSTTVLRNKLHSMYVLD